MNAELPWLFKNGLFATNMAGRRILKTLAVGVIATVLSFVGIASQAASGNDLPVSKVRIVPGSELNLVARESLLPVKIRNDYPVAVRVLVHVEPESFNAILASVVEQTIPANTTDTVKVPISAISDGEVSVRAWVETFSGIKISKPVIIKLHVQAEIEESVITVFAIFVIGLAAIGVVRTVRKRRAGETSVPENGRA